MGTIFLDRGLHVKLFTPAARALFSLIPADYGRPLADITHRLLGVDVLRDAEQVLATLQTIEHEVRTTNERVYVLRVLPYRVGEDRIGGVVITFFDITERTRAEEAVRESEAKYRTLFETIDEGFCLAELIRDAADRPVDIRYLEVNGVFRRQTGLHDAAGKTHTDLGLKTEQHWFETFGQVARTGVAARFESYHEPTQRWYNVFVSRADDAHSDRLTLVFDDITERKGQEQRQSYLLKLSDVLRPLSDAAEIQGAAARVLGEHLGVTRAMYAEVEGEPGAEVGTLRGQYHAPAPSTPDGAGVPPFPQRYRYAAYGEHVMALRRRGETMVVADVGADPRFDAAERAAWLAGGVRAAVTVPLVKAGRFVVDFGVQSAAPRPWTAVEVALVEATAERTWAAVERARAEAALRESEETARAFVSATTDVVYEMSADWRVMRYLEGKTFVATTERPRADWMGGYVPKDEQPRLWAAIQRAIDTRSTFELEHRVIRLDGTEGWTFSRAVPRLDERGELIRWFGAASDITERRRAEEALRESEARFRTLADTVPQLIWTNDTQGRAIYFNQRWYDYSGLSEEQSLGPGWQAIVHPDDEAGSVERWQQDLSRGVVFEREYRLRGADGSYRWHLGRNVPLRDAGGAIVGWFGSATDIEALRQAELARQESAVLRRLAVAQEEERLRIARDLHDQLGQQIAALIMGLSHLAGAVRGTEGAGQLAQLQALAVDLAKESHRIAVNLRPTALDDVGLVPALERLVADWSAQSQVPAVFESQGMGQQRLPRPVEVALFRVAQEALTNVHKHARATSVSLTLQRIGGLVALVVEDNGRGFDLEAPVADARPRLGVLGMRERVAQIGGTLEVEAAPGSGTTVLARVPLDPTPPAG